jgi:hypothetical protein
MKTIAALSLLLLAACGGAPEGTSTTPQTAEALEAAAPDSGDLAEAATPPPDEADAGSDATPACIESAPAQGAVSDDCFAFDTCSRCGVPSGTFFWCSASAGAGTHPDVPGCVVDGLAQSGWVGSCCPTAPCARLSDDDSYCAAQGMPGCAYACPGASTAKPAVSGCQLSGAALSPAQESALYCCP